MLAEAEPAAQVEQRKSGILRKQLVRLKRWSKHAQLDLRERFSSREQNAVADETTRDSAAVEKARDLFTRAQSADACL